MNMKHTIKLISAVFMLAMFSSQAQAIATLLGNAEQGAPIHKQRCAECHAVRFGGDGSAIYTREDHRIKTIEGLMQQVQMCNQNTQGSSTLSTEQEDDITAYLNETFYRYDDE